MSLLPKYFYRRYMLKTLNNRVNGVEEDRLRFPNQRYSLLGTFDETYESASKGFFASSGDLISEE